MENKTKAQTYIGFSIRNGKSKIGTGAVETLKRANLMIVCCTASENTVKQAKKLARKLNAKLIATLRPLEEYTFKPNGKVMAICDKDLANAILDHSEKEFVEVGE